MIVALVALSCGFLLGTAAGCAGTVWVIARLAGQRKRRTAAYVAAAREAVTAKARARKVSCVPAPPLSGVQ